MFVIIWQNNIGTGADAINISGLLVKESRLLNPKKLGDFKSWMP